MYRNAESLGGDYANHIKASSDTDLLVADTDSACDEYAAKGLIAQLDEDTADSAEMRNVQNLIDRNVRNFVYATHRKV